MIDIQCNKLLSVAVCHRNVLAIREQFHTLKVTKFTRGNLKIMNQKVLYFSLFRSPLARLLVLLF